VGVEEGRGKRRGEELPHKVIGTFAEGVPGVKGTGKSAASDGGPWD
jgi:hypothetical protein